MVPKAAQSHSKPIDTLKHATGHYTALQRDKIQLNTGTSAPQSGKLRKALVQPHPWGTDTTIKRNYNLPVCRQETPTL